MKRVVVLLSLLALCYAANEEALFESFVRKYQRPYFLNNDQRQYYSRFQIFKNNLKYMEEYNTKYDGITLGITPFADLTNEEFQATKRIASNLNLDKDLIFNNNNNNNNKDNNNFFPFSDPLPSSFNWADHNVVGQVKSQGSCGSSMVFAVVDSVSSVYAIQSQSTYQQLSVEQVEKCSDFGCNGQQVNQVVYYIVDHGLAFNLTQCPSKKVPEGVCIKGAACSYPLGNETALAYTLIQQGPLFVSIDGSSTAFQLYESGIYDPPGCSTQQLDTDLLLVGFTDEYWICQNSWGTGWGQNGYIWIARNKQNACGIASYACYPTGVSQC